MFEAEEVVDLPYNFKIYFKVSLIKPTQEQ